MNPQRRWVVVKRGAGTFIRFALVQAVAQLLTAITGLVLVRGLAKPEYALLAAANSMQAACQALGELGTGIGLRSLGGRVWNDATRFGELLRTSLFLRRRFGAIAFGVCLPITCWLLLQNGASMSAAVALCLTMILALLPLLGATTWVASSQLHGEYRRIQNLEVGSAAIRLALVGLLALSRISAVLAALAGAVANWVQALVLRKWAHEKANIGSSVNVEDRKELVRLSVKSLPNTVFFCFQGQVMILILTITGGPAGVADFTALGRLAALFSVFSAMFTNVLAPKFARCQEALRLRRLYFLFISGLFTALTPLVLLAWLWPHPFLWVLGSKYASLQRECGWVVLAGCIGQIGGAMWTLNSNRAWIRFQTLCFIPVIVAAQASAAWALNLHRFHDVLIFNLVTATAPIPIYILDAVVGFRTAHHKNDKHLLPSAVIG